MKIHGELSPIRGAFQMVWNLNIKAVPSSMVWAISFWFVIESHSLAVRSAAIVLASLGAFASSVIVVNEWGSASKVSWKYSFVDRFSWKVLLATGLLLDLSLQNLGIANSRGYMAKTVLLSIFISCLILWLFALLLILPLRVESLRNEKPIETIAKALDLVRHGKRHILLAFSVVLLAWPIFFVYLFLALTFAQCVIVTSYGELIDASLDSPKMRV